MAGLLLRVSTRGSRTSDLREKKAVEEKFKGPDNRELMVQNQLRQEMMTVWFEKEVGGCSKLAIGMD